MASLADLERLLERIFERTSARLFRTRLQAVQVERRVERAMERGRLDDGGRTDVPDRYRVRLAPPDLASAAEDSGGAEALAGRLADTALAFARAHGYHLRGRPTVALVADPSLAPGEVEVDAVLDPVPPRASPSGGAVPGSDSGRAPGGQPATRGQGPGVADAAPAVVPGGALQTGSAIAGAGHAGVRGDGTETLVFRRPAPAPARAVLRSFAPDGSERTIEVDGGPLTIGRARDNNLVLADPRVSRHHGRLQTRHGALVYTDLGSTNGTRVNGVRVDEIALGAGDRIQLGDTVFVVETLPG